MTTLDRALRAPGSTPSSLAAAMKVSLPSVSQMVDRLVKLGYLERTEDARDRRRRELRVTPLARAFLVRLRAVRAAEFEAGMAALSADTRRRLANALARAAEELADA